MNEQKIIRAAILVHAEEMGILEKVKQHEAKLAGRFIQQPTEEDLAAYAMALNIVASRAGELMTATHGFIKTGETEPAPIEVQLQPTDMQIEAGIKELGQNIPEAIEAVRENMDDNEDQVDALLSDTLVYVWQAMIGARDK
ncbi:internal virion protein [Kosakonia phage Kc237]|nr:internal virion protein [Kosakonia phage Kc237]